MSTLAQGQTIGKLIALGWLTEEHPEFAHLPEDEKPVGGPVRMRRDNSVAIIESNGSVVIQCPRCERWSPNWNDVFHRFCVGEGCGWHEDMR